LTLTSQSIKHFERKENFSGKSNLSIQQDFCTIIVASNLTSLMALLVQNKVEKRTRKLQLTYQK